MCGTNMPSNRRTSCSTICVFHHCSSSVVAIDPWPWSLCKTMLFSESHGFAPTLLYSYNDPFLDYRFLIPKFVHQRKQLQFRNSPSRQMYGGSSEEEKKRQEARGKKKEIVTSLEEVHKWSNLRSWPTTLFFPFTPFTFTLFRFSAFVVVFYFATIHLICSSANRTTTWIAVVSIRRLSIDTLIRVREVYLRPVTVVRRRPENVLPFLPTYWSMSSRGEVPLTPLILLNVDA